MIEDLATVATVVLSVPEGKLRTATHANVRVYPIWGSLSINHRRRGGRRVLWWETETYKFMRIDLRGGHRPSYLHF